ncbi:MAG: sugar transferase, partial [Candidatus Contubernalis sp.]|nr:sugar transferase [Candidatus Contubernalis sp.]
MYVQERVGRKGKLFMLYKFRTMVENAEGNTG